MSASASASTAPSRPRKLQADTISSVLLDRRRRVVRRTVLIPIVLIVQRLFQHSVGQSAHMLANALHSSHQRSHRPGVQRRLARCVGFGRAVADYAGGGLDGVASANSARRFPYGRARSTDCPVGLR